jgi:hypothetical protein
MTSVNRTTVTIPTISIEGSFPIGSGAADEVRIGQQFRIYPLNLILASCFWHCSATIPPVADWSFLTNHARALLFIAHDPDFTERTAYSIVADLTENGYVAKQKDGRRNVYHIQSHMPVRDSVGRQRAIGELLGLFLDGARPSE